MDLFLQELIEKTKETAALGSGKKDGSIFVKHLYAIEHVIKTCRKETISNHKEEYDFLEEAASTFQDDSTQSYLV